MQPLKKMLKYVAGKDRQILYAV